MRAITIAWCRAMVAEHRITAGELQGPRVRHRDTRPRLIARQQRGPSHRSGPARTRPFGLAGRAWA